MLENAFFAASLAMTDARIFVLARGGVEMTAEEATGNRQRSTIPRFARET